MGLLKNKKAGSDNILIEQIIFIILNVIVFGMLLFFVVSQTSSVAVVQEKAAKKIALAIDSMEKGTEVTFKMEQLFDLGEKNNQKKEDLVKIDTNSNLVIVSAKQGSKYSYQYFTDIGGDEYSITYDDLTKEIIIKLLK